MEICLISPGHLSTNPRLVKEAHALLGAGHRVTVICGSYLPWGMTQDLALRDTIPTVLPVPFGPAQPSRLSYLRQTASRHAARAMTKAGLRNLRLVSQAQHPAAEDLARAARSIRADLYIAHYVAALPAAAAAAGRHGGSYAFDAEDFHVGDLPDRPEHAFENGLIADIEARLLPGAAFATAASPLIAEAYAERYGIATPTPVLNLFPRTGAPAEPTCSGTVRPGPSVYWFSQSIGPGRGLEALIDAAARASSQLHIYLRGAVADGYRADLTVRAGALGISDRLHFLAPMPPGELESDGARFDLGYAGELPNSPNHARALSNKLFSYLCSGIPLVMSETPAQRAIAPELGLAAETFPVGDVAALARSLDLLLSPERLAAGRHAAWHLGQGRFAWENEASKLVDLVEGVHLA